MITAKSDYLAELKRRAKESHVYQSHQLFGLEIAAALKDERHKSLYIKLAKQHGGPRLLKLAKEVAERPEVKNRGAYFMALLKTPAAQTVPQNPYAAALAAASASGRPKPSNGMKRAATKKKSKSHAR